MRQDVWLWGGPTGLGLCGSSAVTQAAGLGCYGAALWALGFGLATVTQAVGLGCYGAGFQPLGVKRGLLPRPFAWAAMGRAFGARGVLGVSFRGWGN